MHHSWATTERKFCCGLFFVFSVGQGLRADNQAQPLQLPGVDMAAFSGVNAGGGYTGMAEDIRQPGQVFFQGVVRPGKKMAQTVGKDFAWLYTSALTEGFHLPPDVGAV